MDIELEKIQKQLNWLSTKLFLDGHSQSAKTRFVKRGEVYWYYCGMNIGGELSKATPRPCVIVQNDISNLHSGCTIICPITHNTTSKDPGIIPLTPYIDNNGNVILDGRISVSNIRCISKARLGNKIIPDKLDKQTMKLLDKTIASRLSLMSYYHKLSNRLDSKLKYIEILKSQRDQAQNNLSEINKILGTNSFDDLKEKLQKLLDKSQK